MEKEMEDQELLMWYEWNERIATLVAAEYAYRRTRSAEIEWDTPETTELDAMLFEFIAELNWDRANRKFAYYEDRFGQAFKDLERAKALLRRVGEPFPWESGLEEDIQAFLQK